MSKFGKYSKGNRIMATIKTPAAGVSPYQEAAAAPVVLRADANGNTVLANPTVALTAAATDAAATNANANVIVNGNEALNSLIATSRSGVFEGANVTINLEEQLFNTTNQVTSTTNYPSGGTGEIQYNSGSNSFASSAYFTYTNGNVVTPGIRTDGYFYSNGAPFVGGGNAAIGNFVFTGDTMSISDDANISLTIQGNSLGNNLNQIIINPTSVDLYAFNTNPYSYAELYLDNTNTEEPVAQIIVDGNSTPTQIWTFDNTGNITLPGNTIAINYANGNRITGNVTFRNEIVIGTGTSNLISGLYLAPSSSSADANMYLRVRGNINDEPTHIHFDTGNNAYYNQFIGDDNKYIQLANTGNIVINSNDLVGNAAQWTFAADGTTQFPGNLLQPPAGNPLDIKVTNGNAYSTVSLYDGGSQLIIQDNTTGLNPAWALFEADLANVNTPQAVVILKPGDTGNEVRWTFDALGNLTLPANTFAVNYANGNPVVISGGAAGLPLANGTSNINIATANGNVTVTANATTWTFAADSTITLPYNAVIKDTVYHAVAFGEEAGKTNQGQESVAIGHYAGRTTQGSGAVAIGVVAGNTSQGQNSVAIGSGAGRTSQAESAVAIGSNAGSSYQGEDSIAIGYQAGYHDQQRGVAIGYQAGVGGTLYRSVSDAQGGSGPVTTYSPAYAPNPSRLYVASTANIAVSQRVFGNNIQANTVVTGINPGEDRVDITPNYTAAMTDGDPLTFVGVVIGINDASNIIYPMRVTGTDIPANTFVQSTGCSIVTLSQYPTAPLADGASLVFNIGQGAYSTAVGYRAGQTFQADGAVAIGYSAGLQNQSQQAVAVGQFAGYSNQSANAVAVGTNAGEFTQAVNAVAVGYKAGYSTQGARAVAIGEDAGFQNQGEDAVAVGQKAGFQTQGRWAVAIGNSAGRSGQQDKAVSIGYGTGAVSQQDWAVAIGANAASYNQGYDAVAIGELAGNTSQGNNSIAIGYLSGYDTQGANSIAIGAMAGQSVQGNNSIILNATGVGLNAATANTFTVAPVRNDVANTANVMFYNATSKEITYGNTISVAGNITGGNITTGVITLTNSSIIKDTAGNAVTFGRSAGQNPQGINAVAVGNAAGNYLQGNSAVAVGDRSGGYTQGISAVAVGQFAGNYLQGNSAVAIGNSAGLTGQGLSAVAIGAGAGATNQGNNSIIINATAANLEQTTANTFTVKPVRGDSTANLTGAGFKTVYYNSSTGEFAYSTD